MIRVLMSLPSFNQISDLQLKKVSTAQSEVGYKPPIITSYTQNCVEGHKYTVASGTFGKVLANLLGRSWSSSKPMPSLRHKTQRGSQKG